MSNFSFAQLQETHICAKICCISGTFDMFYEKLSPAFCWVVNLFVANIASCCSFCKHNPTKEISPRWWTYWAHTLLSYFHRTPFVQLSTCFSQELLPMHQCKNQVQYNAVADFFSDEQPFVKLSMCLLPIRRLMLPNNVCHLLLLLGEQNSKITK